MQAVQVRSYGPCVYSNETCKYFSLGVLGGSSGSMPGVKSGSSLGERHIFEESNFLRRLDPN